VRAPAPLLALALAAALAVPPPARAAEDDLPARKQALLLLRVLVYDRHLPERAHGAVRVAVVFRAGDRESEAQRDELLAAFAAVGREVVAAGLPVEAVAVPWRDAADLEARLAGAKIACVYVGARLGPAWREVEASARRMGLLTATGSRELVEAGVAIGLVNRGARAGVVVNLPSARAEGADLDAALLGIAEVLR